jgi:hypothetical protein
MTLIGVQVQCRVCGNMKAPIGRSTPFGWYGCHPSECEGYRQEPYVGSLWPGETDEEFGYPVSRDGCVLAGDDDKAKGTE